MKHLQKISKKPPVLAADIPVDAKIEFIIAILTAFAPILEVKEPSN